MNKVIILIAIVAFSGIGYTQNQPNKLNTKDMLDKVDRSDIESDESNGGVENIMPTVEMPTFNMPKSKVKKTTQHRVKPTKNVTTAPAKKKVIEKTEVKAKRKVVFAQKPLTLSNFRNNDKIVVNKGKVSVYRYTKQNTIKYKYNHTLDLSSQALKSSGENGYYIKDVEQFIKDTKALRAANKIVSKPVAKTVRAEKVVVEKIVPTDLISKRKVIEDKVNNGKQIKNEIPLHRLLTNDVVYLFGDLQLVIRKKKSTSGVKKYWLTEKLDVNNKAVSKITDKKFKIIRKYKTN